MSSVFSSLKPVNTVERNGFDLSRRSVFSAKCGQILPVFAQATLPDSEYQIDVKQLLRTQPLQTAAFTGFSVNYDFMFVPNNYGYTSFNEFIAQREDSQHVSQPPISSVPTLPFQRFVTRLLSVAVYDYIMQEHFSTVVAYPFPGENIAHFAITSSNLPWASVSLECVRALDMFGYGNFLPMVKILALSIWRDYQVTSPTESYNSFMQWLADSTELGASTFALLSIAMLKAIQNTEVSNSFDLLLEDTPDIYPTLWSFLSYNKCFYEYYRNSYYDDKFFLQYCGKTTTSNINFDYVQLFNFDDFVDWNDSLTDESFFRLCAMLMPKNHLYKKDLFTGVLPSTQFGDVSVMMDNRDWLDLYMQGTQPSASSYDSYIKAQRTQGTPIGKVGSTSTSTTTSTIVNTKFRFDPAMAISVLEERRADSMQRFKERLMRAGNKVKDVFKAHGWSEPYSASEHNPIFLGTFDGRLDINTVAATTGNSEGQELGQLGANGTAVVQGSKIRFKCHDFGMIIGVMYIVKDAEYDAYGVEKQHCLTDPFDYPYPELQNISLHPIDILEISNYLRFDTSNNLFSGSIVGYLPRYMEYKTAVDKVHGEFYSAPIRPSDNGLGEFLRTNGVFSDWVTPREDINVPTSVSFLYQSPNVADNIFLQQSTALQSSDPFLVNCLFDVMAVEPVSVIGLPI